MEVWHLLLLLLSLNIFVSIFLACRIDLEPIQKFSQILIVWLFPLVAAIGLYIFHKSNDDEGQKIKSGGGHNDSDSTDAGL